MARLSYADALAIFQALWVEASELNPDFPGPLAVRYWAGSRDRARAEWPPPQSLTSRIFSPVLREG